MSATTTLLVLQVVIFLATVLAVFALGLWLASGNRTLKRRLEEVSHSGTAATETEVQQGSFNVHWDKAARKVLLPASDWQESRARQRLVQSGIRTEKGSSILLLSKVMGAIILPTLFVLPLLITGWFQGQLVLAVIWMVATAFLGFLLPDLYLLHRASERRREIGEVFPDVLDLLVVCVEAGLGLDAAIQRVGREIARSSAAMSDELVLVTLEMRAGKQRHEALKGLAERTGLRDIQNLVSILIQAENFGTSVGQALREHAGEMREVRIQRAREKAAKLPVRMTFPILLFIFPALFLVILGPALATIFTGLGGAFGNG